MGLSNILKNKKRVLSLFLSVLLVLIVPVTAFAEPESTETVTIEETAETAETAEETAASEPAPAEVTVPWPSFSSELTAVSACVIDVDTGEVLYGKDEHTKRYPASITKLLTALIVCENCSPDELVTFSESATTNLESGAVTIGTAAGDVLTVEECLYALLLKSANEVANALAEHVAGSVPDFCVLMNRKAASLGCLNSDFHNPNGLTNELHVTTAYDMALIASACMNNAEFMKIEESTSYHIEKTSAYPDGLTVTMGHKMLHPEESVYDSRVKAGKTGFTSASGNTLVTLAEDGGRRVAAVVLKDSNPQHYQDTKLLLDYAFGNFKNISLTPDDIFGTFDVTAELLAASAIPKDNYELSMAKSLMVTVPMDYDPALLGLSIDPEVPEDAPELARARVSLSYGNHRGPAAFIFGSDPDAVSEITVSGEPETEESGEAPTTGPETAGPKEFTVNAKVVLIAFVVFFAASVIALVLFFFLKRKKEERERIEQIRRRREERLKELDMTEESFKETISEKRKRRMERRGRRVEEQEEREETKEAEEPEEAENAEGNLAETDTEILEP